MRNSQRQNPVIRPFVLFSFFLLGCQSSATPAGEMHCKGETIVVHGAKQEDIEDGCEAARSAAIFFKSSGLSMPRNVTITIADAQPEPFLGQGVTGSFDGRQNAIRVLGYLSAVRATEGNEPGLGRIANRSHWRSYIAHELAHAAIHRDCNIACPSRAIHEYVAAVAQIVSLSGDQRSALLAHYADLEPFDHVSEITETYYAINPHYFAVKSYKHYQKQPDRRAFLRSILNITE